MLNKIFFIIFIAQTSFATSTHLRFRAKEDVSRLDSKIENADSNASELLDVLSVHLKMELGEDLENASITETLGFSVTSDTSDLVFDASDSMNISSLKIDGNFHSFLLEKNQLKIFLQEKLTAKDEYKLEVSYKISLIDNPAFFRSMDAFGKTYQFNTFNQPSKARHWIITKDAPLDKFLWRLEAKVPKQFMLMSNGQQLRDENIDGKYRLFEYELKEPLPSYLASLVVGDFISYQENQDGRISYWVDSFAGLDGLEVLKETPKMMSFLEKVLLEYPFSKYNTTSVESMIGGGMEHTTATTFSSSALHSSYARVILLHELVHHWFGNSLTCSTWKDLWLNESFATFFELEYIAFADGEDAYYRELKEQRLVYFETEEKNGRLGPILNDKLSAEDRMFGEAGILTYYKGSLFVNYLKDLLGAESFYSVLKNYLSDANLKYANVSTQSLLAKFPTESIFNFEKIFSDYLGLAGYPVVEIRELADGKFSIEQLEIDGRNFEAIVKVESLEQESQSQFRLAKAKDVFKSAGLSVFDFHGAFPGEIQVFYQSKTAKKILLNQKINFNYAKKVLENIDLSFQDYNELLKIAEEQGLSSFPALLEYGVNKYKGLLRLTDYLKYFSDSSTQIFYSLHAALKNFEISDSDLPLIEEAIRGTLEQKGLHPYSVVLPLVKFASKWKIDISSKVHEMLVDFEKMSTRFYGALLKYIGETQGLDGLQPYFKNISHSRWNIRGRTAWAISFFATPKETELIGSHLLRQADYPDFSDDITDSILFFVDALKRIHSQEAKSYLLLFIQSEKFNKLHKDYVRDVIEKWEPKD